MLQEAYGVLVDLLQAKGLHITPEKVQQDKMINYLGSKVTHDQIVPQKVEIRKDHLCTLDDFQKLLGDINWIRGSLGMTNDELRPPYEILSGDAVVGSPRYLTDEARQALALVEGRLSKAFLKRVKSVENIALCILPTNLQPTGILWQEGPLLWIHPKIFPAKAITLSHCCGYTCSAGCPNLFTTFWMPA